MISDHFYQVQKLKASAKKKKITPCNFDTIKVAKLHKPQDLLSSSASAKDTLINSKSSDTTTTKARSPCPPVQYKTIKKDEDLEENSKRKHKRRGGYVSYLKEFHTFY